MDPILKAYNRTFWQYLMINMHYLDVLKVTLLPFTVPTGQD
jgi:hypothetical protein